LHRRRVKTKNQTPFGRLATKAISGISNYLSSFDDLSALDASGTNLRTAVTAGGQLDTDRLKIGVKSSSRFIVRVRYVISKLRTFSAYVAAFSHNINASVE